MRVDIQKLCEERQHTAWCGRSRKTSLWFGVKECVDDGTTRDATAVLVVLQMMVHTRYNVTRHPETEQDNNDVKRTNTQTNRLNHITDRQIKHKKSPGLSPWRGSPAARRAT